MSGRTHLAALRRAVPAILPSLLLCDFGNLRSEVARLEAAGVEALHLDVMDGHFVPNLTYGMPLVAALRKLTDLPLDVHLMIADPAKYVQSFHEAGADIITIHVEATDDPRAVLHAIGELGAGAGIALNPGTPVQRITDCLDLCDLVLVMSVEAGFGGQPFNPVAYQKLREIRELAGQNVILEVDGGVKESTIGDAARAGADLFVVGSAIFSQDEYGPVVQELKNQAAVS